MKREDDKYDWTEPFIVPLNGLAAGLIKRACGGRNGMVFGAGKVNSKPRMRRDDPAALMRAIWAKHKFPHAYPHDLRRTAATLVQSAVLHDRPKWTRGVSQLALEPKGRRRQQRHRHLHTVRPLR
jgi:hypothetical protein